MTAAAEGFNFKRRRSLFERRECRIKAGGSRRNNAMPLNRYRERKKLADVRRYNVARKLKRAEYVNDRKGTSEAQRGQRKRALLKEKMKTSVPTADDGVHISIIEMDNRNVVAETKSMAAKLASNP